LTDYDIIFGARFHEIKYSRVGIFIETTTNIIIFFYYYFLSKFPRDVTPIARRHTSTTNCTGFATLPLIANPQSHNCTPLEYQFS